MSMMDRIERMREKCDERRLKREEREEESRKALFAKAAIAEHELKTLERVEHAENVIDDVNRKKFEKSRFGRIVKGLEGVSDNFGTVDTPQKKGKQKDMFGNFINNDDDPFAFNDMFGNQITTKQKPRKKLRKKSKKKSQKIVIEVRR